MVTRTSGDQFLRQTAIYSRARIRSRPARLSGFLPAPWRRRHQRSAREPDSTRSQGRLLSAGLSRLLLALALILLAGCSRQARAQTLPTPLPQPTPDKTMDAVIRGLITIVVPTATRLPASAGPVRSEPAPRPAQAAATSTVTRVPASSTVAATTVPSTATPTPRLAPPPDSPPPTARPGGDVRAPGTPTAIRGQLTGAQPTAALVPNRLPTPPITGSP